MGRSAVQARGWEQLVETRAKVEAKLDRLGAVEKAALKGVCFRMPYTRFTTPNARQFETPEAKYRYSS